jgi:hypothetical protein
MTETAKTNRSGRNENQTYKFISWIYRTGKQLENREIHNESKAVNMVG